MYEYEMQNYIKSLHYLYRQFYPFFVMLQYKCEVVDLRSAVILLKLLLVTNNIKR